MGAAGIAGASVAGGLYGSYMQSQAAGKAAGKQERAMRNALAFQVQNRDMALAAAREAEALAKPDAREMRLLQNTIATEERDLARREELIKNIDPAITEAATQLTKLLRGEDAPILNSLRRQRDAQRRKLVNSLREQMGPGAETSSAGIQALNQFDMQTADQLAAGQQSSATGLSGILAQTRASRGGNLSSGLVSALGASNALKGRQMEAIGGRIGALTNTAQTMGSAYSNLAGVSGSQFVGQQLQGQFLSSLGREGLKVAGAMYADNAGNAGNKKP